MDKDYSGWQGLKPTLNLNHNLPTFQERQVWWCSIGVNIGHEKDGKNRLYNRPVLVLKKFSKYTLLGIPLTRQLKDNPYYHGFEFKGIWQSAMLSQIRIWDSRRLTHVIGKLPKE